MYRWIVLGLMVSALGLSATYRWRAYRAGGRIARRLEGPLFIAFRLLIALPLFGSLIVYGIDPERMAWSSFAVPAAVRWIAACVGAATLPAIAWVLGSLGRNVSETVLTKEGHVLVTHGPYRWVRHPLYTTGLILLVSLGVVAANAFVLLLTFAAFGGIRWVVIPREEGELLARFGERYESYRRTTGRFLPRRTIAR
jgi:protein-S-isoprenylcysteine O-methyltransferase Ste14